MESEAKVRRRRKRMALVAPGSGGVLCLSCCLVLLVMAPSCGVSMQRRRLPRRGSHMDNYAFNVRFFLRYWFVPSHSHCSLLRQ